MPTKNLNALSIQWVKRSEEEDCSFQGTAREETMTLSLGSYYDNLAMDSDREYGKISIMKTF